MNRLLSMTISAAILVFAVAVTSAQGAGRLDPGFGDGGTVNLPRQIETTWETGQLPDGRTVIANRDEIVALLPSGEIDPGFGAAGFAPFALPPDATHVGIADLSIDSQGRLVVVGNGDFPSHGGSTSLTKVVVERYTSDGKLDPGFGEGGFATSDFGVPPPREGGPSSALARYAALDSGDRIVIAAQRPAGRYLYKGFYLDRYEGFVSRLDSNGKLDSSFGGGGVLPLPATETLGRPIVDARSGLYLEAFGRTGRTLTHLLANGQVHPEFGQGGGRPVPARAESLATLDGSGRLLLYGYLQGSKANRLANGVLIERLLPDGSLDRSFGRRGAIAFRMPRLYTARIALDEEGRILVGAALKGRSKKAGRPGLPPGLALARLRPDGALDEGFGRRGSVLAPFPHRMEMNVESLSVRNGTALLGGGGCGKGNCHRALVRVQLGSR